MKKYLTLLLFIFSCSSTSNINKSKNITKKSPELNYRSESISLINQLRRFPGVQITGNNENARIMIRGMSSINNQQGPLFYINNSPVGNDFSIVYSMIEPNDIKKIRVLKDPTELIRYGFRGSSGVIIIELK